MKTELTQEQINSYSELMAKFLDVKETVGYYDSYGIQTPHYYTKLDSYRTRSYSSAGKSMDEFMHEAKFNLDRNWLHRVWEKFRDLKFEDKIQDNDHTQWLMSIEIKLCYKSITEAFLELGKGLEWYNTTLTKQS